MDVVREDVRRWVTYGLVVVLGVVVGFGLLQYGLHVDQNEEVLRFTTGLLTPIIALVGPVIGFYFGEKAAAKENGGKKPEL